MKRAGGWVAGVGLTLALTGAVLWATYQSEPPPAGGGGSGPAMPLAWLFGGSRPRMISRTVTVNSSVDSALERFKLDWGVYPFEGSRRPTWSAVVRVLTTNDPVADIGPLMVKRPEFAKLAPSDFAMELKNRFSGPYLKAGKRGVKDGWGRDFHYALIPVSAAAPIVWGYRLWSLGSDLSTSSDDILSEGSVPLAPSGP